MVKIPDPILDQVKKPPRWIDFAVGANNEAGYAITGSSFELNFNGVNRFLL